MDLPILVHIHYGNFAVKIWFNRGLSNTYDALMSIRGVDAGSAFVLRATHSAPCSAVSKAADEFAVEPDGLDGVFNLQTKEREGFQFLLEVNSRMSGGLVYACMSGVAFPYWNLMLTAGLATPGDVPAPKPGVRVAPVQGCVAV